MIAGFHIYNRAQDVARRNGRGFAGYGSRAVLAIVNVRDEAGGGEQAEHGNTKSTGAHETRIVKPPEDAENVNQQAMLGSGGTGRE